VPPHGGVTFFDERFSLGEPTVVVSRRLVAVNSASFALVRFLHVTVFLWVQHYLLAKISAEEYMVFAVIGSLFFLTPVFTLVFTGSTSRYIVGHYAKGEIDGVTTIVSSVLPILLVVGGGILALAALGAQYVGVFLVIPPAFVRDAQWMLLLLAITVSADLVLAPFTLGPHILQKYVLNNGIELIGEVIKIGLMIVLLFTVSTRALWVAVANAAAELFCLIVRALISRRMIPQLRFSLRHVKLGTMPVLFSYGFWNAVVALGNYFRDWASLLVMNRFSSPVHVNCFSVGATMERQAHQLWEPVRASLSSPLIALHVNGRAGALRQAYCMGGRYALWLVMAALMPLIILRHEFVSLYAPKYPQAADVVLLLLIPIPLRMVNVMLPQMAQAKAQLKGLAVRTLVVYGGSVLAVFAAVWWYHAGSVGAAAVYAAFGVFGDLLLIWPHASTLVGTKFSDLVREIIVPGVIPIALGAAALLLVRAAYHPDTWPELAAAFTIGLVAHSGGVLLAFRADDRKGLAILLKRKLVRA
jgi:O-antigen/teichoic acid export membrane protein